MNLSITSLQDNLAKQSSSLSKSQRAQVLVHATASADLLTNAGVTDETWLHVVQQHHTVQESDLAQETRTGGRLAELLRRVDIYLRVGRDSCKSRQKVT